MCSNCLQIYFWSRCNGRIRGTSQERPICTFLFKMSYTHRWALWPTLRAKYGPTVSLGRGPLFYRTQKYPKLISKEIIAIFIDTYYDNQMAPYWHEPDAERDAHLHAYYKQELLIYAQTVLSASSQPERPSEILGIHRPAHMVKSSVLKHHINAMVEPTHYLARCLVYVEGFGIWSVVDTQATVRSD
jgi:hypothetical protein